MSTTADKFVLGARALAASLLLLTPFAASDSARDEGIVEQSQRAFDQWQARVTDDLNRALANSSAARLMRPNNAIVRVAFTIGEDGRARDLRVLPGEGNWPARRAALYAVRQLRRLDEIPIPAPHARRFVAHLVFFDRPEVRERLLAESRRGRTGDLAANERDPLTIIVGHR